MRPLGTFTHEGRFYHHVEFTLSHVVWHRPIRHFSQVKLVTRTRISELELANAFSPEITVSSVAQSTGNSTEIIQLLLTYFTLCSHQLCLWLLADSTSSWNTEDPSVFLSLDVFSDRKFTSCISNNRLILKALSKFSESSPMTFTLRNWLEIITCSAVFSSQTHVNFAKPPGKKVKWRQKNLKK